MAEQSAITPEIKSLMDRQFGPAVYEIEKWWLHKFAEAIDDPNPKWKEEAPPTFATALELHEMADAMAQVETPFTRNLNGGNELEYHVPVRLGDTITVTGRVIDIKERGGKLGKMLILRSETTYTNQRGEVAVKSYNTQIKY